MDSDGRVWIAAYALVIGKLFYALFYDAIVHPGLLEVKPC